MNKLWKELEVSLEEEKLAEEIVNGGAGKSLSQELLNQYHVEKNGIWKLKLLQEKRWFICIGTRMTRKSCRCLSISMAADLSKDAEIRISCSAGVLPAEAAAL